MTLREALNIQAMQVEHYSKFRADLAEVVASKTDVKGYDLDKQMPIAEVNKLVPRGWTIEYLCRLSDVQKKDLEKHTEEAIKKTVEYVCERDRRKT